MEYLIEDLTIKHCIVFQDNRHHRKRRRKDVY